MPKTARAIFFLLTPLWAACEGLPSPAADATGDARDAAADEEGDAGTDLDGGQDREAGQTRHDAGTEGGGDSSIPPPRRLLPPSNVPMDYQLGGAYEPPQGVRIVVRDRTDPPVAGLYNVCYVNGFQVQPGEEGLWSADLILRDDDGQPVIDPDWDELLLDVTSSDKRGRIAERVADWLDGCAGAGFDAVEIDNLDTYSRSGGRISQEDAVSFMALLSEHAHRTGLAIAQKNSSELLSRRVEMGTDFVVAEECSRYDECSDYVAEYGEHVLMIEYRASDFDKGCAAYGATHSVVLRDLHLVPLGQPAYVFDGC